MQTHFLDALTAQNNLLSVARLAHWNVRGDLFYSYHLLFMRIYETIAKSVDGLAELARGHDVAIPESIFTQVPALTQAPLDQLLELNQMFREKLEVLHDHAESNRKRGITNFVEGILTDLDTVSYLLKSNIE